MDEMQRESLMTLEELCLGARERQAVGGRGIQRPHSFTLHRLPKLPTVELGVSSHKAEILSYAV